METFPAALCGWIIHHLPCHLQMRTHCRHAKRSRFAENSAKNIAHGNPILEPWEPARVAAIILLSLKPCLDGRMSFGLNYLPVSNLHEPQLQIHIFSNFCKCLPHRSKTAAPKTISRVRRADPDSDGCLLQTFVFPLSCCGCRYSRHGSQDKTGPKNTMKIQGFLFTWIKLATC